MLARVSHLPLDKIFKLALPLLTAKVDMRDLTILTHALQPAKDEHEARVGLGLATLRLGRVVRCVLESARLPGAQV